MILPATLLAVASLCLGLAALRIHSEWRVYQTELELRTTLGDAHLLEMEARGRQIEAQRLLLRDAEGALTRCVRPNP
jgi:hypothetical protein